jgi:Tol biopolymer transport system component
MSNEAIVVEVVSIPGEKGVTPDLGRVALTNWGGDFSAIGVCNLQAGSVEVLQAGRKANLRHPALSPDGATIAFTARGVNLSTEGFASLHLAPARGGEARRIGARANYSNPSFSPDGSRILVFAGDERWGPVQLVEIDLASGAETVLQFGAFEGSNKTAYDPVGQGYLVGALGPAASLVEATSANTAVYDTKHGSPRAFRIPREGGVPRPVAPAADVGKGASLFGVTPDGDVILLVSLPLVPEEIPYGYRAVLVTRQGEVRTLWRTTRGSDIPSGVSISADGKRLLAVTLLTDQAGNSLDVYKIAVIDPGQGEGWRVLSQVLSSDLRATNHDLRLA